MIKNERQYRVTRRQLDRFEAALNQLGVQPSTVEADLRTTLESDAVAAQAEELRSELAEFDDLRHGRVEVGQLGSLDDLPRLLIRSRIAQGLTQRDLADRLGMAEQQVQRYEADDWATANLRRLLDVATVLGVATGETVRDSEAPDLGYRRLVRQLRNVGLDPALIARRFTPPATEDGGLGTVLDLVSRLHRIFGWSPADMFSGKSLTIDSPVPVGYKGPKRASEPRAQAYTVYTHYIALLALRSTEAIETRPRPPSSADFRAAVLQRSAAVTFPAVLEFVWDLGIPVVPLSDPGGFHAVLWRSEGRNAIVLKQQNRTLSRWVFDLLHEIGHVPEQADAADYVVIEDEAHSAEAAEVAANQFAGDVLLGGRAEALAQEAVETADGRLERLKAVVPRVARRNDVQTADLANYLAFRLSLQGLNWWGAAANLQVTDGDPWDLACATFCERSDVSVLNSLDRDLLAHALSK